MVTRVERIKRVSDGGVYFGAPKTDLSFIKSGCTLLDCVLGGGWALGRMSNIIGDKSTGKTLLAIEATANFARQFPKGRIWYREAESAFDQSYAKSLGMPISRVEFRDKSEPFDTVEDMFEDLERIIGHFKGEGKKSEWVRGELKPGTPGLYIVDSLDALSDREEMKRDMSEGSYSLGKQKKLGQIFRRQVRGIERSEVCVLIVSQIRDKIGVTFGEKKMRAGGKALDFYASHCLWLSHIQTLKTTVDGESMASGVRIKAKAKKNKISMPFRECEFDIRFGYGIDDVAASLDWLVELKRADKVLDGVKPGAFLKLVEAEDQEGYEQKTSWLSGQVESVWYERESKLLPKRQKYA